MTTKISFSVRISFEKYFLSQVTRETKDCQKQKAKAGSLGNVQQSSPLLLQFPMCECNHILSDGVFMYISICNEIVEDHLFHGW
ncbi:hypothetical protein LOK49_LG06G02116 [Camellia lanceoleosa]|uniref:Uncharacterized protein n=1 Tax=Camellia lanceoleosa TaxID=1840588 RepID=A0ACC0HDA9_9ERIC|nr:hypothetical protein LOK49_LG06G02116 [Camellia lanceoleosa]